MSDRIPWKVERAIADARAPPASRREADRRESRRGGRHGASSPRSGDARAGARVPFGVNEAAVRRRRPPRR